MSLTYKTYLSSLNTEEKNEHDDWGQHYDMESQILINAISPLKHPILNKMNQTKQPKQPILKQINNEDLQNLESGLKKYIAKQSNNSQCNCKSAFITSIIYISHLVLFVMIFK
jgi:hypothetical protein